jgi:hypothetical protein
MTEPSAPVKAPGAGALASFGAWMRAREALVIALFACAFAALFGVRLLRPDTLVTASDWDYTFLSQSLAVDAIERYGEWPLWTPYVCGGMPFFGNPQSRVLTPMFPLHLLFGVDTAIRLELVLHVALAFAGAYYLGRTLSLSRSASFIAALVFPACSLHYAHFAVGHAATTLPIAYLPWPLGFALRALHTRRASFAALAGAVIVVMFGEGGAYATAYSFLALGAVLSLLALTERRLEPLKVLGLVLVFTLAFGAAKFATTLEVIAMNPRHTSRPDGFFPLLMLRALFSRNQDLAQLHTYQRWGWHEYSAYVSPGFALLAVVGAVLERRRTWLYSACLALFLSLAVGYLFSIWETPPRPLESPWTLLHRIPPFSSLRVPARLMALVVLFVGILVGFGADALRARLPSWAWRAVLAGAALSLIDAWVVGTGNLEYAFRPVPAASAALPPPAAPFAQFLDTAPPLMAGEDGPATRRMSAIVATGRGVLNCYEPIRPPRAARGPGEPGYRGEQYLTGEGSLRLVHFSPQRLTFDVGVRAPTTLVVNRNFDDHFRVVEGVGEVVSEGGLLAVRLPAGTQRVSLGYRCWAFLGGVGIGVLALIATVALWLREKRQAARVEAPE